jgi:hypothetical protein
MKGDRRTGISRSLDGHGKRQDAYHGYSDQPGQPFHTVEAQQPAIAPNVRGHDTTLPGLQPLHQEILWEAQPCSGARNSEAIRRQIQKYTRIA